MKTELTEYQLILQALKVTLKEQRITYKELAQELGISESGLKKIFGAKDGSFQRLVQICQILGTSIHEILAGTAENVQDVNYTQKQQAFLLDNPKAFQLFWALVYERQSLEDAIKRFTLTKPEAFSLLRKLDRHSFIRLLPQGRLRLPPIRQIRWVGKGPLIDQLYRQWSANLLSDVVSSGASPQQLFLIRYFRVTPRTLTDLIEAMRALELEFVRRATQDMRLKKTNLIHLRWLSAIDDRSYLDSKSVPKN